MIPLCNLHTHTTFCDGKNTPEEMVLGAIAAGCETLGFSGHSSIEGEDWCIPLEKLEEYISEIRSLKEKYRGQIEIYLGIEYDMISDIDLSPYDYVIGAAHYVCTPRENIPVDLAPDALGEAVGRCYGGDFYRFCDDYYKNMYSLCDKTKCDIVAHFDLVTKFNEGGRFFDESDRRYRHSALEALDFLLEKDVIFEINTGAISRGWRKEPYPARFIVERMAEKGARVMLNSDTHSKDTVFCAFSDAAEYARSCGIRELTVLKDKKFVTVAIG